MGHRERGVRLRAGVGATTCGVRRPVPSLGPAGRRSLRRDGRDQTGPHGRRLVERGEVQWRSGQLRELAERAEGQPGLFDLRPAGLAEQQVRFDQGSFFDRRGPVGKGCKQFLRVIHRSSMVSGEVVDGFDAAGAATGSPASNLARANLPRWRRDFTVPSGTSSAWATSS